MLNIVWLKRDLRLADHAPLFEASKDALKNHYDLLFLYVIEDEYWNLEEHSFRHWEFIKDSLAELQQKLRSIYQQDIMIMRGDIVECFSQLHTQHNINAVHSHEETGIDWTYKRDLRVAKFFREIGVEWHEHPNGGVIRRLKTRDEWKKLQEIRLIKSCIPEPDCLAQPPKLTSLIPFLIISHYPDTTSTRFREVVVMQRFQLYLVSLANGVELTKINIKTCSGERVAPDYRRI